MPFYQKDAYGNSFVPSEVIKYLNQIEKTWSQNDCLCASRPDSQTNPNYNPTQTSVENYSSVHIYIYIYTQSNYNNISDESCSISKEEVKNSFIV